MHHQSNTTGSIRFAAIAGFALALAALAGLPVADVSAAENNGKQRMLQNEGEPGWQDRPQHGKAGKTRKMRVNAGLLKGATIELDIMDETVTIVRDRVERHGKRHLTWIGHVQGEKDSSEVVLTRMRGAISGTIQRGDRLFEVTRTRGKQPIIFEVDKDALPEELIEYAPFLPADGDEEPETGSAPATGFAGPTVIDLLTVYTAQSCNRYGRDSDGGCSSLESKIIAAVAAANQAYSNSLINVQLNLVHMDEVSYSESGDMGLSLSDMQRRNDGRLDQAHSLRDTYGADVVSLISEDSNACGVGYIMTNVSSSFSSYAFNVVYSSCLSSQTLAHEIGHNMGSAHDRDNAGSAAAKSYSYGHRECGNNGFTTVMAYYCSGASGRSYFSNPNVSLSDGRRTGTSSENNARSINETAVTMAAFRPTANISSSGGSTSSTGGSTSSTGGSTSSTGGSTSSTGGSTSSSGGSTSSSGGSTSSSGGGSSGGPVETAPAVPTGVAAATQSNSSIRVRWADRSDNESGFHIDRSIDSAPFQRIAQVSSNTVSLTNNGLNPGVRYRYRVRSYNGTGTSAWSSIAVATTSGTTTPTTQTEAPDAPSNLRYSYYTDGRRLVLAWNDNTNDEVRFDVLRNNIMIARLAPNQRRFIDRVSPNRVYSYRVRVVSRTGSAISTTLRAVSQTKTIGFTLKTRMVPINVNRSSVILEWAGARGSRVDVYRDGIRMSRTPNDGRYVYTQRSGTTPTYRICETVSNRCSTSVRVRH